MPKNIPRYKFLIYFFVFLLNFLIAKIALAFCPVCTIAVGAGVGLSRWLGVDDTITGIWIGALAVSLISWTINWLNQKNIHFKFRRIVIIFCYYLIIISPLYLTDILGHPLNQIWGMDKLLLGIILGSLAFLIGILCYYQLKKKNEGRIFFPFQKVVIPVLPLILFSIIFYYLTK